MIFYYEGHPLNGKFKSSLSGRLVGYNGDKGAFDHIFI